MRLDGLEEKQFEVRVKTLLKDIDEIKTFQYSGKDSNRMYRIFSNDAYDIEYTSVGFDDMKFRVYFDPDDTTFETSIAYKMEYTYTEAGVSSVEIYTEREKVSAGNAQSWIIAVMGSDFFPSTYVRMKFFFWASGSGTFRFEAL